MASVLHNSMLNTLTCTSCEKYLSVLPVKVYPNRIIKCGRCCQENDGGVESLFGKAIKKCLFKCINRYEGCNKLLTVSEVVEHEFKCESRNFNCPKCEYKFSGSAYHLLKHYTKQHPRSILRNDYFFLRLKTDFRERYLYLVNDVIFFVLVDFLGKDQTLYLSAVSLLPQKNVSHWFSVKKSGKVNNSTSTTTEKKPCLSLEQFQCDYFNIQTNSMNEINCRVYLDLSQIIRTVDQVVIPSKNIPNKRSVYSQTDEQLQEKNNLPKVAKNIPQPSVYTQTDPQPQQKHDPPSTSKSADIQTLSKVIGVELTDEFKREYPGYELTPCGTALVKDSDRIELTCSNCKQLTGCNVYTCLLNRHIVCWDCKAWCGICNTPTNGWSARISSMNESLLLPCKWQCGQHYLGNRLTQHELDCEKPKFNCPSCGSGELNLKQLNHHLVICHENCKNFTQFNISGYLKECKRETCSQVCFFQNGMCFKMYWVKKALEHYEVLIESFGNTDHYEMAMIYEAGKMYNKITNNKLLFTLADNPRFYLKRIRNL